MSESPGLQLFEGFGIEIEYMIVDAALDVMPVSDKLLHAACGAYESEIERGDLAWSNELVLHVIEFKTNGPADELQGLAASFQRDVGEANRLLTPLGGRLMPTAMHPWMDPERETQLWPHEYSAVYETFDRIFGCRGHGWSNLQSMHINLPYQGDEELSALHSAIRLLMPLLPALAASSPVVAGRPTGLVDNRLDFYRKNCRAIPSVTGRLIPEVTSGVDAYRRDILEPIRRDVAQFDEAGILDPEWVNARGAIVRMVRDSVEIRVIDVQEAPQADLAIAALTVASLEALVAERHASQQEQEASSDEALEAILLATMRSGERARIDDQRYLACFGVDQPVEAGELWRHLAGEVDLPSEHAGALDVLLNKGPLARRILAALGRKGGNLHEVYAQLCQCLDQGCMFVP